MQGMGHRCGYVGVPKGHPLFEKNCDDYLEIKKEDVGDRDATCVFPFILSALDDDERTTIDCYFQCHGGITYSGGGESSKYPIESDLWWFGFDCAHAYDLNDFESAKRLFSNDEAVLKYLNSQAEVHAKFQNNEFKIRTLEYVEEECRKLADQLSSFDEEMVKK